MRELGLQKPLWLLPSCLLALIACSDAHSSAFGSESNWLRSCPRKSDCSVGTCVCGVCSGACAKDSECASGLRCQQEGSALYSQTCGVDLNVHGLCAPSCKRDADCGAGQACSEGACAPAASSAGKVGAVEPAVAGPDGGVELGGDRRLVVDAHLDVTTDCVPDLERPMGSGAGVFDLGGSTGANAGGNSPCGKPYLLVLRVRNLLSENVLATKAQVLLLSSHGEVIVFDRVSLVLPNPFELSITGSVPASSAAAPGIGAILAEAIPVDYANQLDHFAGGEIAIRVQLAGETAGGMPVKSNAFEYRVSICDHCLIECITDLNSSGTTVHDIVGGKCDDRAAADGRYCFDPGC